MNGFDNPVFWIALVLVVGVAICLIALGVLWVRGRSKVAREQRTAAVETGWGDER